MIEQHRNEPEAFAALGGHTVWVSALAEDADADELEQLRGIAAAVLRGDLDRGTAAVLNQLLGSVLRTIELQRRLDKHEELLQRLERFEGEVVR
jgi:hypothetical protein